ncbi:hypothetical protein LINPERHAP2_LOCUS3555, partial [Linum perenne]
MASGSPWFLGGDFKAILDSRETSNQLSCFTSMEEFKAMVRDCDLEEHVSYGPFF